MIAIIRRSQGKFISLVFLSIGIFILIQVIAPIVAFEVWMIGQRMNNQLLVSPKKTDKQVLGVSIQNKNNFPAFISTQKRDSLPYSEFQMTVPRLNIKNETVYVESNDLSQGLIQLPGSALPGEKGNVFISGHSAISRLFNKNAIFARLSEMKKGDKITVEAAGAAFVYEVSEIKIVDSADLSVILPPESVGRYISLMTCVPPGLNLKRLVILGKMV